LDKSVKSRLYSLSFSIHLGSQTTLFGLGVKTDLKTLVNAPIVPTFLTCPFRVTSPPPSSAFFSPCGDSTSTTCWLWDCLSARNTWNGCTNYQKWTFNRASFSWPFLGIDLSWSETLRCQKSPMPFRTNQPGPRKSLCILGAGAVKE